MSWRRNVQGWFFCGLVIALLACVVTLVVQATDWRFPAATALTLFAVATAFNRRWSRYASRRWNQRGGRDRGADDWTSHELRARWFVAPMRHSS